MTDSGNDDGHPNEIRQPLSVDPPRVDGTDDLPSCQTPMRQVDLVSQFVAPQQQQQSRFVTQQDLPVQPSSLPSRSDVGDSDTAATTAAMSVTSLDDTPKSAVRMERENFLLFIKILFKVLEEDNDASARSRAQRIVMECRRRNQQGDPNYTPLMDGVERHLRAFVGEVKWRRSHLLLHHYMVTKRGIPGTSPATNRTRPTAIMVGK